MSTSGYSGAGWIEQALKVEMSEFGRRVADLLGDVFLGIYHMNTKALKKADWTNERWIEVVQYGGLASVDGNELTRLVLLCHDRMIRVEVTGCGPNYIKLGFSTRLSRTGNLYERCPTIESAIASLRKHYGTPVIEPEPGADSEELATLSEKLAQARAERDAAQAEAAALRAALAGLVAPAREAWPELDHNYNNELAARLNAAIETASDALDGVRAAQPEPPATAPEDASADLYPNSERTDSDQEGGQP